MLIKNIKCLRYSKYLRYKLRCTVRKNQSATHVSSKESARNYNPATCPITGFSAVPGPKPVLPIFGTLLDLVARAKRVGFHGAQKEYYEEHGEIIRQTIFKNEEIVLFNPQEMLKVFRSSGPYPVGIKFWPMIEFCQNNFYDFYAMKDGEEWREMRRKLQPNILSPQAAATYLPYLTDVARTSSKAFGVKELDIQTFSRRAIFDALCNVFLGRNPNSLLPDQADPRDLEFLDNAVSSFHLTGALMCSQWETFKATVAKSITTLTGVKIESALTKEFNTTFSAALNRANELTREEMASFAQVQSTKSHSLGAESQNHQQGQSFDTQTAEMETDLEDTDRLFNGDGVGEVKDDGECYLARLLRQNTITLDQAGSNVAGLLMAGLDTTSTLLLWNLIALAENPSKQDILAGELKEVLRGADYDKNLPLPYLKAFCREVHRVHPVSFSIGYRKIPTDVHLSGYTVPKDTQVFFNTQCIQNDPKIVENVTEFLPERWSDEAVAKRRAYGAPQEILDHPLLATPFSFGSRMCLGARIAELTVQTILARLVQDYRIELCESSEPYDTNFFLVFSPSKVPRLKITQRQ